MSQLLEYFSNYYNYLYTDIKLLKLKPRLGTCSVQYFISNCMWINVQINFTAELLSLWKSVLPTNVEATVLFEQDFGDLLAVKQQVVLDVSGSSCWGSTLLHLISGETHLKVAQGTAGHKALQLLSGKRKQVCRDTSQISLTSNSTHPIIF